MYDMKSYCGACEEDVIHTFSSSGNKKVCWHCEEFQIPSKIDVRGLKLEKKHQKELENEIKKIDKKLWAEYLEYARGNKGSTLFFKEWYNRRKDDTQEEKSRVSVR